MSYYYNKYEINTHYTIERIYNAEEQAENVNNLNNPQIHLHEDYFFSFTHGYFSGRGDEIDLYYGLVGSPNYSNYVYYVTRSWAMRVNTINSSLKIQGTKLVSNKVEEKGRIIAENIIAEDGDYPNDGKHTDGYWYVKKGPANKAPSVSGKDQDLGDISAVINYKYTVFDEDNDNLSVVERLNNEVIEVRNNVKSGSEFTATIGKEKIYSLELGKKNTLQIEVSDGTERVYRNITFTRINTAPIIQVLSSKDLGEIIDPFDNTIKVTDVEGDSVGIVYKTILVEKVNNNIKKTLIHQDEIDNIKLNSELKYSIPQNIFSLLLNGDYELEITATDSQGGESKEVVKFTRTEDTIDYLSKVIETEVMAKQIMIMPTISGTPKSVKIMACNNAFDKTKAWEDVTNEALNMLPYNFKNTSKTAAKWGIQTQFILSGKGAK